MDLEQYYAGDKAFEKYSNCFNAYWADFEHKTELLNLVGGDVLLAKPIAYHLQKRFSNWFFAPVPALDGLTPAECMKSNNGIKRLKTCLHRMH